MTAYCTAQAFWLTFLSGLVPGVLGTWWLLRHRHPEPSWYERDGHEHEQMPPLREPQRPDPTDWDRG